jgi:acyl-CoA dehydrogenase
MSDPAEVAERVRAFVRDVVIPAEARDLEMGHGPAPELREELQAAARSEGLLAPHVGRAFGGLGLDVRGQARVFEEAGYSLLGPLALNCSAPDEGNMHLLEAVASQEQQERYLRPLAAGDVRSAFAMTEPAPGAGSDPTMLLTKARRDGDDWVIDGRKHLITGAQGCAFFICMARTADEIRHDEGATMFLVGADNPGVRVERLIPTMDRAFSGGHAEVAFDGCRVPSGAVLGEAGLGYRYAQVRLAPARLTHCMRWLGLARRALDVALDRASARTAFGVPLLDQGMVQALVADSVIEIEASRGLIRTCAEVLDSGERGTQESSVAKVFVSEAVGRIVDRSLQICGGLGATDDLPLARYAREVRGFRIYDGPSETHRWSIARRAARRRMREQ